MVVLSAHVFWILSLLYMKIISSQECLFLENPILIFSKQLIIEMLYLKKNTGGYYGKEEKQK